MFGLLDTDARPIKWKTPDGDYTVLAISSPKSRTIVSGEAMERTLAATLKAIRLRDEELNAEYGYAPGPLMARVVAVTPNPGTDNAYRVSVHCPICYRVHTHGASTDDYGRGPQHRVPHCGTGFDRDGGYYFDADKLLHEAIRFDNRLTRDERHAIFTAGDAK